MSGCAGIAGASTDCLAIKTRNDAANEKEIENMTKENFYCKFDIYAVDDQSKPEDTRHVMSVTASTEADWLMWDNACKKTEGLFIDSDYAELSDWACEMHRQRDIANGVRQFQYSEGV